MPAMPTKPAASAARACATIRSKESRICGRKRKNSIRSPHIPLGQSDLNRQDAKGAKMINPYRPSRGRAIEKDLGVRGVLGGSIDQCVALPPSRRERHDHRDARAIEDVGVPETGDEIVLLELYADEDVARGRDREDQVAERHRRSRPECDDEAEIDRMSNRLVKKRRAEFRR